LKLGLTTSGESVEAPGFPTLLVTLIYVQALAQKAVVLSLCSFPVIGRLLICSWFVSDFVDEISGFVLLFCLREEQVCCVGVFRVRREAGGEGVASYAGGISSC